MTSPTPRDLLREGIELLNRWRFHNRQQCQAALCWETDDFVARAKAALEADPVGSPEPSTTIVVHPEDRELAAECFERCIELVRDSGDSVRRQAARALELAQVVHSNECEPRCAFVRGHLAKLITDSSTCWLSLSRNPRGWFAGEDDTLTVRVLQ